MSPPWSMSRRTLMKGLAGVSAMSLLGEALPFPVSAASLIADENANPGSNGFRLTKPAGDTLTPIAAYARQSSVKAGERVSICVRAAAATTVECDIYRIGYYQGLGGRLVERLPATAVGPAPAVRVDAVTGLTQIDAPVAFTPLVRSDWVSGIYVAKITDPQGWECVAMFAVRDDRRAAIIYQQPTLTYAAYTGAPTGVGKALYDAQSEPTPTVSGRARAVEVTLDRPHHTSGFGDLLNYEIDGIKWLEANGYDVTYQTVVDTAERPDRLLAAQIVVSAGHDEYWPQATMDAFHTARDAGVHLAFFGGNIAYWRVRLGAAEDGRPNRVMTCYKTADTAVHDPSGHATDLYRRLGAPEHALLGSHWDGGYQYTNAPFTPTNTNHWFWSGSGAVAGGAIGTNILGYEMDRHDPGATQPPGSGVTLLSSSTFLNNGVGPSKESNATIYQAPSGAYVFAAGTISWTWGLGRPGYTNSIIQVATANLLNRMLANDPRPPATDPEPFAPFASADAFVRQQYRDLLGREADSVGLVHWATQVGADGAGMAAVTDQFLRSAEFAPRFTVARLYQAAFRRIPDPGGYDYWFDRYNRGLTIGPMANHFAASPEFVQRYGVVDDDRFVVLIYQNVFDRDPDTTGRQYWVGRLRSGLDRGSLLANFSESPEGVLRYQTSIDVIAVHQGLFRRPPTPSEYQSWVGRLATEPRIVMIQELLGSEEYEHRIEGG